MKGMTLLYNYANVDSHRPTERALNIFLTVGFFTRLQQLFFTQVWKKAH